MRHNYGWGVRCIAERDNILQRLARNPRVTDLFTFLFGRNLDKFSIRAPCMHDLCCESASRTGAFFLGFHPEVQLRAGI